MKRAGIFAIIIFFCLVLILIVRDHIIFFHSLDILRGKKKGIIVNVTYKYPDGSVWRYVDYCFAIDNKEYRSTEQIDLSVLSNPFMEVGDSILVHYNPSNPNQSSINQHYFFGAWYILSFVMLAVCLFEVIKYWKEIRIELKRGY